MISCPVEHNIQKSYGRVMTKLGDELVRWQEQADSIFVVVRINIRPMSGIQNVTCSAWWRYALNRVPFQLNMKFFCGNILLHFFIFKIMIQQCVWTHYTYFTDHFTWAWLLTWLCCLHRTSSSIQGSLLYFIYSCVGNMKIVKNQKNKFPWYETANWDTFG